MQYAQDIWTKTLEILERELGMSKITIDTWFSDSKAVSFADNCLTVAFDEYKQGIVINQFSSLPNAFFAASTSNP